MSLRKAVEHKKEFRKPWYRSERFDGSCRPHGGCPYCERNHTISALRVNAKAKDELRYDNPLRPEFWDDPEFDAWYEWEEAAYEDWKYPEDSYWWEDYPDW